MQCSPPTSFTGVSMESIAIYSSLLSRLNKGCRFPGNPPNMSSERLCPRSRNSDEEHDLAALRKDWAPYAELQRRKADEVFKGSVGHQELAAWVEELGL